MTDVKITTNRGAIVAELFDEKSPETVANFLKYVDEGFYDGTIFHRVIPDFMIQGGGFDQDMQQKTTHPPIRNEADNGLSNETGTLAMARTSDINSATSQFFINLSMNDFLDHGSRDFGYAVFGEVKDGMDVVEAIGEVQRTRVGPHADVPVEPVVIERIERI